MRKYVGMVLALICIVTLTACGSDKKITLPELEKITEIEIIKNKKESYRAYKKLFYDFLFYFYFTYIR